MAAGREPPADAPMLVGVIAGAHGVRGAVRIKGLSPDALRSRAPFTDRDGRALGVRVTTVRAKDAIAAIDGVGDRDAAAALAGTELYLARAALPALGAEEYYHADLVGLEVERADGAALGKVSAVFDFGAGDVIEIATARGAVMVPFTRDAVPVVDLAGGRLVVAPPPGLPGFDDDAGGDGGRR